MGTCRCVLPKIISGRFSGARINKSPLRVDGPVTAAGLPACAVNTPAFASPESSLPGDPNAPQSVGANGHSIFRVAAVHSLNVHCRKQSAPR